MLNRRDFLKATGFSLGGLVVRKAGFDFGALNAKKFPLEGDGEQDPLPVKQNVVLILTDDQDYPSLEVMRKLRSFMDGETSVNGWTNFSDCGATQGLCAPYRATLLTGLYPHQHGVLQNSDWVKFDRTNTIGDWLKASGYLTGWVGKWMFGSKRVSPEPTGFDVFHQGGRSDAVAERAESFLSSTAGNPFFLVVATADPHSPYKVPRRYRKTSLQVPAVVPADPDVSDKPECFRRQSKRQREQKRINYYKSVLAIDDLVERVVNSLVQNGQIDQTVIIITSDSGYHFGPGYTGKNTPYEQSVHVPLVIRDPKLQGNYVNDRMVSTVDLAATLCAYTGIEPAFQQSGRNIMPLVQGQDEGLVLEWNDEILIEGHYAPIQNTCPGWYGIRSKGYTYIYHEHEPFDVELYDREIDPYLHHNVAGLPEYAAIQTHLAERLELRRREG